MIVLPAALPLLPAAAGGAVLLAAAGGGLYYLHRHPRWTGPRANPLIVPAGGNPVSAERARALATLFDDVWPAVTGRPGPMPLPAKLVALAQAAAEGSGYGDFFNGNVGSYQCGGAQQGTSYYDCVEHQDSRPDPAGGPNIAYTTTFRQYKDGPGPDGVARSARANGAYDFLKSITVKPFPALDELLAGDILGYARKQYGQHYYEGFNLSEAGLAAYAPSVKAVVATAPPVRRAGETPEGVAGRIVFYAAAMARSIPQLAAALGIQKVPVRATADLLQPWRPAWQAGAGAGPAAVAGAPPAAVLRPRGAWAPPPRGRARCLLSGAPPRLATGVVERLWLPEVA